VEELVAVNPVTEPGGDGLRSSMGSALLNFLLPYAGGGVDSVADRSSAGPAPLASGDMDIVVECRRDGGLLLRLLFVPVPICRN
jgi:hypothetical protein